MEVNPMRKTRLFSLIVGLFVLLHVSRFLPVADDGPSLVFYLHQDIAWHIQQLILSALLLVFLSLVVMIIDFALNKKPRNMRF